jgi:hypothetical protein
MKVNDIINEGPLDWAKRIGAGIQGAVKGAQASQAQREAGAQYKDVSNRVFKKWNEHLAAARGTKPQMTTQEVNQLLTTWADQEFNDKVPPGKSAIPAPAMVSINDAKKAFDYLNSRVMEYFGSSNITPTTTANQSQLRKTFAAPKADADIDDGKGNIYGYDIDTKTWYDEDDAKPITNPTDIQALNARYYQLKQAALAGQGADPDVQRTGDLPGMGPQQFDLNPDVIGGNIRYPTFGGNKPPTMNEGRVLKEGGNAIKSSTPVKKEDVAGVVELTKKSLPSELLSGIQTDIGSAGYKIESGDIDVMIEAEDLVRLFKTQSSKDPAKDAKILLKKHFEQQGIEAVVNGRNVSIGVEYTEQSTGQKRVAQVDVMAIHEAKLVAPWHQHGQRGMYNDPDFKGSELFMLISSIAKHMNLKFDAFGARLVNRDTGDVVARTRKQVAKVLLGPKAKESDLNSVKDALKALEKDPDREGKLAQARQDAAKGLMRLPETAQPGTAAWFRQMSEVVK